MEDLVGGLVLAYHERGGALVELALMVASVVAPVVLTVGGVTVSRWRTGRWRQQREAAAFWAARADAVHEAPTWTGRPWL